MLGIDDDVIEALEDQVTRLENERDDLLEAMAEWEEPCRAMLEALTALGVRRVALGSAYTEEVNTIAARFLAANGFEVAALQGLGYVDNLQVGRLPAETATSAVAR